MTLFIAGFVAGILTIAAVGLLITHTISSVSEDNA